MDRKILVTDARLRPGNLVEEGERLVKKLEEKKFPITAAFWRYYDEEPLPRLVIVSPRVGRDGPLETYTIINETVDELGEEVHFGLGDISVMSPYQGLRRAIEDRELYVIRWNPDASREDPGK